MLVAFVVLGLAGLGSRPARAQQEACCFADGGCLDLDASTCRAGGGTPQGPGSDCGSVTCTRELGACCIPTPFGTSCALTDPVACERARGSWLGAGSACTPGRCDAVEACCLPDGSCLEQAVVACVAASGRPQGPGSSCSAVLCERTEACCPADGSPCQDLTPLDCAGSGGVPQGVGTTCARAPCPTARTACCFADGSCLDLAPLDCYLEAGTLEGAGTDCASFACPDELGACCAPTPFGVTCRLDSEAGCEAAGGTFLGLGVDCLEADCSQQACCLPDGSCEDLEATLCLLRGGAPQGRGTDCGSADCGAQACCLGDGSCTDALEADCLALGGEPQGSGTGCGGADCSRQACCLPDDSCSDERVADCLALGGEPQGSGTDCAATACGAPALPGRVPDGTPSRPGPPLRVGKAAASPELLLSWSASCSPEATDHTVHEGRIGSWYGHGALLCDTMGALVTATVTPGAGNRYYLIAPVTDDAEGSYGVDSGGNERPVSGIACRPAQLLGCP